MLHWTCVQLCSFQLTPLVKCDAADLYPPSGDHGGALPARSPAGMRAAALQQLAFSNSLLEPPEVAHCKALLTWHTCPADLAEPC